MKNQNQSGSAHVIIIAVLVVALAGTLGVVAWQNFVNKPESSVKNDSVETTAQTESSATNKSEKESDTVEENTPVVEAPDTSTHAVNITGIQVASDLSRLPDYTAASFKQYLTGVLNSNSWRSNGTDAQTGQDLMVRDQYTITSISPSRIEGGVAPVSQSGEVYPGGAPCVWVLSGGTWSKQSVQ